MSLSPSACAIGSTYFFDPGIVNPSGNGWTVDQYNGHDGVISVGSKWAHYVDNADNAQAKIIARELASTPDFISMDAEALLSAVDWTNGYTSSGYINMAGLLGFSDNSFSSLNWEVGLFLKSDSLTDGLSITLRLYLFVANSIGSILFAEEILVKTLAPGDLPYSFSSFKTIKVAQNGADSLKFFANDILLYTTESNGHFNLNRNFGGKFSRVSYAGGIYQTHVGKGSNFYAVKAAAGLPSTCIGPMLDLLSPTDGSIARLGSLVFSWEALNGTPDYYLLQISKTADFSVLYAEVETTLVSVEVTFQSGDSYYWRVKGVIGTDVFTSPTYRGFLAAPLSPPIWGSHGLDGKARLITQFKEST